MKLALGDHLSGQDGDHRHSLRQKNDGTCQHSPARSDPELELPNGKAAQTDKEDG